MAKAKATKSARVNKKKKDGRSRNDRDDVEAGAAAVAEHAATNNHSKKRKVSHGNASDLDSGGSDGPEAGSAGREEAPQPPREEANHPNEHDADDRVDPCCTIKLPMRPNLFPVPETWWMVDLHARPFPTQGATPLVRRCMRELGWNEITARSVLQAYRQFLSVKVAKKDWNAELLSPSIAVDQMWHQHLLDNLNYAHDRLLLCDGHYVRHDPDGGLDAEARKIRLVATQQALLECLGEDDGEGGGGGVDTSATGPWKEVFEAAVESDAASTTQPSEGASTERSFGPTAAYIDIVLTTLTGRSTHLRVMPTARMGAVFAEYGWRTGVDPNICRFFVRERNLDADDTPIALGLQNGDRVYVHIRVRGC